MVNTLMVLVTPKTKEKEYKEKMNLERQLRSEEGFLLLQRSPVSVSTIILGDLHLPITPTPEAFVTLHRHSHTHEKVLKFIYINTNIIKRIERMNMEFIIKKSIQKERK